LPVSKSINGEWSVTGNFCSWECAKTYNRDYKNDMDKNSRYALLTAMYTEFTGNPNTILFAPPRECLSVFGGNMSINEYRNALGKRICSKTTTPIIHSEPVLEINNFHWTSTEDARNNFNNFKITSEIREEPLKLSRKSVKKTNQNTLEQSMGILKSTA
jgi:hypothetical protein